MTTREELIEKLSQELYQAQFDELPDNYPAYAARLYDAVFAARIKELEKENARLRIAAKRGWKTTP